MPKKLVSQDEVYYQITQEEKFHKAIKALPQQGTLKVFADGTTMIQTHDRSKIFEFSNNYNNLFNDINPKETEAPSLFPDTCNGPKTILENELIESSSNDSFFDFLNSDNDTIFTRDDFNNFNSQRTEALSLSRGTYNRQQKILKDRSIKYPGSHSLPDSLNQEKVPSPYNNTTSPKVNPSNENAFFQLGKRKTMETPQEISSQGSRPQKRPAVAVEVEVEERWIPITKTEASNHSLFNFKEAKMTSVSNMSIFNFEKAKKIKPDSGNSIFNFEGVKMTPAHTMSKP